MILFSKGALHKMDAAGGYGYKPMARSSGAETEARPTCNGASCNFDVIRHLGRRRPLLSDWHASDTSQSHTATTNSGVAIEVHSCSLMPS